jgi:hypothetical protein
MLFKDRHGEQSIDELAFAGGAAVGEVRWLWQYPKRRRCLRRGSGVGPRLIVPGGSRIYLSTGLMSRVRNENGDKKVLYTQLGFW